MKSKMRISTIIGIVIVSLLTVAIILFGYRVIATSGEVPGKLSSVSVAANNLQYSQSVLKEVQKVEYDVMKYGFMDDMLLAQMDYLDRQYERVRLEEVRAVNNLTAMSKKTEDNLAYQQAKAERDKEIEQARVAARAAELAKQEKIKEIARALQQEENGTPVPVDTGDSSDPGSGSTASSGGRKGEPVYADTHGESLGKYVITAYCTCRICCGVYSGGNRTASGTVPTTNRTIAVDTNVIPFGTRVVINGQVYVAEDRGGAIKGKRIDMFFYTHKEALRWGRRTMEVYLAD